MPYRAVIASKMADFLGALSHPLRVRIVEELGCGEKDVSALKEILGASHSSVSQHLSVLRAHKAVLQRKVGNRVFYRLTQTELADWLLKGFCYIDGGLQSDNEVRSAAKAALAVWGQQQ